MDSLREWREKRLLHTELPGGLKITLKRVNLIDLASAGKIPTTLSTLVDKAQRDQIGLSDFSDLTELINIVVVNSLIDPPLSQNGSADDDHLSLSELDFEDKVTIFNAANEGAIRLEFFRRRPQADVAGVQPGGDVPSEAERLPEHPG